MYIIIIIYMYVFLLNVKLNMLLLFLECQFEINFEGTDSKKGGRRGGI